MKRKIMVVALSLASMGLLASCGKDSSSTTTSKDDSTSSADTFDKTQAVVPYTRDTNSGTREGFMEKIGLDSAKKDNSSLKTTVQEVASNGAMIQALSTNEYGIGYFSHDSIKDASDLGVKVLNYGGVEPTETNILNGTYKLARSFNYCYANETDATKKTIVDAFVAYMSTSEGLTTIKSNGGIVEIKTTTPTWASIKGNYVELKMIIRQ